mmetsp:Transcript_121854/g.389672  ORF Transcript_121854/g.389672 Transcript_121854/m.389672 type:complete len:309 (+) Transcript_121854:68-994(+)
MAPKGKKGTDANALAKKNILNYLQDIPDEGPNIWLQISSGNLCKRVKDDADDTLPDYKRIGELSCEFLLQVVRAAFDMLSALLVAKLCAFKYGSSKDRKLGMKIFCFLFAEAESDPIVTHSKKVFTDLYKHKKTTNKVRKLVVNGDYSIDFMQNGCFKLAGKQKISEGSPGEKYTVIEHIDGDSVPVPDDRIFKVDIVWIQNNWDDKAAYVTHEDGEETLLKLHKLFCKHDKLKISTAKDLSKIPKFKDQILEAEEVIVAAGASASSSSSSRMVPSSAQKRRLSKKISDVSIPEELLATPKAKAAKNN